MFFVIIAKRLVMEVFLKCCLLRCRVNIEALCAQQDENIRGQRVSYRASDSIVRHQWIGFGVYPSGEGRPERQVPSRRLPLVN